MSSLFESAIQEVFNIVQESFWSVPNIMLRHCFELTNSKEKDFMCQFCDHLIKVWISKNALPDLTSDAKTSWIGSYIQSYLLEYPIDDDGNNDDDIDEGSFDLMKMKLCNLVTTMITELFASFQSVKDKLRAAIQDVEKDQVRLIFISELFTVAVRKIHGHTYHENLRCGDKGCHNLVLDAIKTMVVAEGRTDTPGVHPLLPASSVRLETLEQIAACWGLRIEQDFKNTTSPEQHLVSLGEIRTILHALLSIYKVVAGVYNLDVPKLTDFLIEKQQRNKIVHYNQAIRNYAFSVGRNGFSLVDFINDPNHETIARALDENANDLREIFSDTCFFQRRGWDKRFWPREKVSVDPSRDPYQHSTDQAFDAIFIRDDGKQCWLRPTDGHRDERWPWQCIVRLQ